MYGDTGYDTISGGLHEKTESLTAILKDCGRITVALSGGVDSVFLLAFARDVLGAENVRAITASGPHFAGDETDYAARLCRDLGVEHLTVDMDGILDVIGDNPPDRCYICKKAIFSALMDAAAADGSVLADGTNLDDMYDYRPGRRALEELGIASPLKDAGLTKQDIRIALHSLAERDETLKKALFIASEDGGELPMWEKPAFACLASRIPYGEPITEEKLKAVYDAESFLKSRGFRQVRVRHHGDVARIEVPPEDRKRFFDEDFMDEVNEAVTGCGFAFAALDLGGYRMGSLNDGVSEKAGGSAGGDTDKTPDAASGEASGGVQAPASGAAPVKGEDDGGDE